MAHRGTIFLDEIGELPLQIQSKLLRVLESKTFCRVGSTKRINVDVRVVAATNQNLYQMCNQGTFRKDLFYRLNTIVLELPPLRERQEEIEPLVNHFIATANQKHNRDIKGIEEKSLHFLKNYSWPGNIRELRNVIERVAILYKQDEIDNDLLSSCMLMRDNYKIGSLTQGFYQTMTDPSSVYNGEERSLREYLQEFEEQILFKTLCQTGGSRTKTCKLLKMPMRTLCYKIKAYGLKKRLADFYKSQKETL